MDIRPAFRLTSLFCTMILAFSLLFGCSDGDNGTSSGAISGTVKDTAGNNLAGISVVAAAGTAFSATASTAADGTYTVSVPVGSYDVTFSKSGYTSVTNSSVAVVGGVTTTSNATLTQTAAAVVNVANGTFTGGSATLSAQALVNDPALQGQAATFEWKDAAGTVIGTGSSITVPQPTTAQYKATLAEEVAPLHSIDPADVTIDPITGEEERHKDIRIFETLDRMQVVGIPQEAFDDAAVTHYTVTATIGGQTFTSSPTVSAPTSSLPFIPNPGIRNVPIGQPVLLQGKDQGDTQTTWNWSITSAPAGSTATIIDPTTRFPHFVPNVVGTYIINESVFNGNITIYAGKYVGILLPTATNDPLGQIDAGCSQTGCHSGSTAFNSLINDKFTEWNLSGHREIMVQAMGGTHYSLGSCARCHSIGWSYATSTVSAGGFNDIAAASGFTDASFQANAPNFFTGFDQVLRVSEVQCEACHGPNDSEAHAIFTGPNAIANGVDQVIARISYSADVCAPCHGEPLRHGRFQEWRESGHGDYETAIGEGVSGGSVRTSCASCHAGQGFIQWIRQLQAGNSSRTLDATSVANLAGLNEDNVEPQTCVTCHTPHNAGKQSGLVGAIVVLRGDYQSGGAFDGVTPILPAGFQANGVGRGALCITCHNSRNGEPASGGGNATLHEDGDANWGTKVSTSSGGLAYASPHEACQGDVLMGRNAYFYGTGQIGERSRHSILADACVTCHLQKTPADPTFGYPPGVSGAGTNHSFGIITDPNRTANEQVNALCAQCHGSAFDGTGVQKSFAAANNALLTAMANATLRLKYGSVAAIPAGTTLVFTTGRSPRVSENGAASVTLSSYLNGAPGTANPGGTVVGTGFNLVLAKANWNAALVEDDGSQGVHNPSFTFSVINATLNAVNAL